MVFKNLIHEKIFEVPPDKRIEMGNFLRKLRESKKLSFLQLAELSNVSASDIHLIERGTKNKINPFHLKALAKALDTDYKAFYLISGILNKEDFSNDHILNLDNDIVNSISRENLSDLILSAEFNINKIQLLEFFDIFSSFSSNEIDEVINFSKFLKFKKNM
ncbi:helix-turn-helix domain-containing protein [Cetobacterium sp.]|uniref:helix-turn-helix domain-containing protein n=1 Tax=Cetobacterium sp. TaxID=2071632 RepID=UPI003F2C8BFF